MTVETPILLLVYNRADFATRVVDTVLQHGPRKLYVAGDGPRTENDRGEVTKTREALLRRIPDDVEVATLFRDENLGCKRAVESAITWLFEHEDTGIILEDDCVPGRDFFAFCETMLDEYQNDPRIMHISGFAHHPEDVDGYFFDRVPAVWGWATWRRAWKCYVAELPAMDASTERALRGAFASKTEATWYTDRFSDVATGRLDSWAFTWVFAVLTNHGLCVRPLRNLVQNIGIGDQRATHTRRRRFRLQPTEVSTMEPPYAGPRFVVADHAREQRFFRKSMRRSMYPARMLVKRLLGSN